MVTTDSLRSTNVRPARSTALAQTSKIPRVTPLVVILICISSVDPRAIDIVVFTPQLSVISGASAASLRNLWRCMAPLSYYSPTLPTRANS